METLEKGDLEVAVRLIGIASQPCTAHIEIPHRNSTSWVFVLKSGEMRICLHPDQRKVADFIEEIVILPSTRTHLRFLIQQAKYCDENPYHSWLTHVLRKNCLAEAQIGINRIPRSLKAVVTISHRHVHQTWQIAFQPAPEEMESAEIFRKEITK